MTADAQCDQVFEAVVSKLASRLDVVHLKVFSRATILAAPAVSAQNLFANSLVRVYLKVFSRATILAAPAVSAQNLFANSLVRVWIQSNPRLSRH